LTSRNACRVFTKAARFEQSSFCNDAGLSRGNDLPCPGRGPRATRDGLRFLRPTLAPKCVSTPGTYASQAEIDKCQDDVNRYVNSVTAYRVCQTQEVERAVRETNATLQPWKCGVAAKALCPQP
jgi:hypothetical protein